MNFKKIFDRSKLTGTRFIRGINIPPQLTVPKMPPVEPPKKKDKS